MLTLPSMGRRETGEIDQIQIDNETPPVVGGDGFSVSGNFVQTMNKAASELQSSGSDVSIPDQEGALENQAAALKLDLTLNEQRSVEKFIPFLPGKEIESPGVLPEPSQNKIIDQSELSPEPENISGVIEGQFIAAATNPASKGLPTTDTDANRLEEVSPDLLGAQPAPEPVDAAVVETSFEVPPPTADNKIAEQALITSYVPEEGAADNSDAPENLDSVVRDTPPPMRDETSQSEGREENTRDSSKNLSPLSSPRSNTAPVLSTPPDVTPALEVGNLKDQPTLPQVLSDLSVPRATPASIDTLPTQTIGSSSAPNPAQQIMVAIERLHIGDRISLRLDPPDLGNVSIRMEIVDGTITAVVAAERPDTVELLTRHRAELGQLLSDAGFDDAETRIDLQGRESSRGRQDRTLQENEILEETIRSFAHDNEEWQQSRRSNESGVENGRLDIRV